MRASSFLLATVKETPNDAELISHKLMIRAGLIRKLGSGLYSWLPLGLRVLRNVEKIVREEMNAIDAQEVLLPATQPAELWIESERWDAFGPQLLKFKDRHQRDYCYGPTHEEVITDMVRSELRSYKQLPCTFYQIQTKFRDEIRPRFGVMRAREFLMKDAYSFHINTESLEKTYQNMYQAYTAIFTRLGLQFRAVLADTGAIGGALSHEFQVLADSGEDAIAYCPDSDYAANVELARSLVTQTQIQTGTQALELIKTPNITTVKEQAAFMGLEEKQILKTLLVKGTESIAVALLIRGDDELNEIKVEKSPLVAKPLTKISVEEVLEVSGCKPGFVGPKGLTIPLIADPTVLSMIDFSCGANQDDTHYIGMNWERDLPVPELLDIRMVQSGDLSPDGKGTLSICRGIEVGHIFQLGQKYSQSMNATVLDDQGKKAFLDMGCYGIGITRIVAAAIEQHHDENGILWPEQMAPFQLSIIPMNFHKSSTVQEASLSLYQQLKDKGYEVFLDDRNERAGVLFNDHDLIGIPHRIVIGDRGLESGIIEYKSRREADKKEIPFTDLIPFLETILIKK